MGCRIISSRYLGILVFWYSDFLAPVRYYASLSIVHIEGLILHRDLRSVGQTNEVIIMIDQLPVSVSLAKTKFHRAINKCHCSVKTFVRA